MPSMIHSPAPSSAPSDMPALPSQRCATPCASMPTACAPPTAATVSTWQLHRVRGRPPMVIIRLPKASERMPGIRSRYSRQKARRSEEHTSELQSLMRISYDVFCLKKKKNTPNEHLYKLTQTHN